MVDVLIGVAGLVFGALITIIVSRYYYQKTVNKKLSVYGLSNSQILSGISTEIRHRLSFRFDGSDIEHLQEISFVAVNDGERSISNIIEPLSILIGKSAEILDAAIIHKDPDNLVVDITVDRHAEGDRIKFLFPILNRGEYFIAKILVSGSVAREALIFDIVGEDISRKLPIQRYSNVLTFDTESKSSVLPSLLGGFSILLATFWFWHIGGILYKTQQFSFEPTISGIVTMLQSILTVGPFIVITILLLIFSLGLFLAAIFGGEFPPRRKPIFRLPEKYNPFLSRPTILMEELDEERLRLAKLLEQDRPKMTPKGGTNQTK